MPRLITTNLRFPEATYRELRYQAGRRNVPLALLVREAVDRYLGRTEEAAAMPLGADPADAIIGSVTGGPDDESINHDHYLYGWPKETEDEAPRRHERSSRSVSQGRERARKRQKVPSKSTR